MFITAGLRALQILFSIIILGVSISLIKGQDPLSAVPSQTSYAAFCGGLGIVVTLIGIAAFWVEALQGIITAALDGLTTLLMLGGGITFWATLGVHSCSDIYYTATNVIIRGDGEFDGNPVANGNDNLTTRCQQAQATTAFLFFSFIVFAATALLSFRHRSGGKGSMV